MSPQPLGQHFLADSNWRERIARAVLGLRACAKADTPRDGVWIEIGAGHGEMTSLLARQAKRVVAIEFDAKLLPSLREGTAHLDNVTVVAGDVLALDLPELAEADHFRVYGNLPYYITSPIVHRLFECPDRLEAAFVVVQWEVAARLASPSGHREYGYLSTFAQFYSRPEILLRIPPGAFRPPPKVASALVALRLPGERAKLNVGDERAFMEFLKGCFAQKRKTLRNNLRPRLEGARIELVLEQADLAPTARAEELNLAQFARLFTLVRQEATYNRS